MKILIVCQYFWPENFLINQIALDLSKKGHEISVLTSQPNYPKGNIYKGYKSYEFKEEKLKDITIHRVPIFPRKQNIISLLLNYITFPLSGCYFAKKIIKKQSFDVVFVYSLSPFLMIVPGVYINKKKKIPLVLYLQDLWPETLKDKNLIFSDLLIFFCNFFIKYLYSFCSRILVQSEGFKRPVSKFVSPEKIIYVPNTSNLNFDKYKKNRIYMDKEKFNLVFLGNLGEFQGLKIIIDAAKKLEKEKRLKIVICGMGSKFQWLNRNIKNFNLTNIELKGWVDPIFIPDIMSQASALLITLKDGEALSKTIPSKIQTYLAIGKPIIASLNGSGAKILLESNSGYVSKAEQVEPLVKNIKKLMNLNKKELGIFSKNAKNYFDRNFLRKKIMIKIEEILEEAIRPA